MSLIGKALAVRNSAPVPYSDGGLYAIPGMAMAASPDAALMRAYGTNGTVYANVSLLASSVAAQPWKLFREAPQDGRRRYTTADKGSDERVEVTKHQALSVLNKPAWMMLDGHEVNFWTRQGLFEVSQIWLETTGKAAWVVEYDPRANFPVGLWPVRPDRMQPVPDPEQFIKGWIYTAPNGREKVPLQPWEVIFARYPDPLDPYGGAGPIGSVLVDVDAAKYGAEWNRNFFLNSAEPGGVLQVDHTLKDTEFNSITNRWREAHQGVSRAHRIALLEAGVTFVETGQSMKDMDFSNLRSSSRDIIRESLGMHKIMTGVTDDVNRASAQTGEEIFAAWKVAPRLLRWRDDVINAQFLPLFGTAGQGVEFDFVDPIPKNREADAVELTAKAAAALDLVTAGYKQEDVLQTVGLPAMDVALQLTTAPALPPRWTAPLAPTAAVPGDDGSEAPADTAPDGGEMQARLRKMLSNGHLPVGGVRR